MNEWTGTIALLADRVVVIIYADLEWSKYRPKDADFHQMNVFYARNKVQV